MVQLLYVIRGSISITWRLTTRKTTQGKALIYGLSEPHQVMFEKGTKVLSIVTDEMYFRTHAGHRYTGLRPIVIANDTPIREPSATSFSLPTSTFRKSTLGMPVTFQTPSSASFTA